MKFVGRNNGYLLDAGLGLGLAAAGAGGAGNDGVVVEG